MKLLFDCDGTLLDSMHIWTEPLEEILKKYDYKLTKEEKGSIEALDYTSMCHWLAKNIAKDMTVEELKAHFDKIIHDAYENTLMSKDGARDILYKLKESGFEMAVASSTDIRLLEKALRRLELIDFFEFIITPDSSPYNKGQEEFWELACHKLDEKRENVMLFDDALYAIKAAKLAGLKTCGLKDFPYNEKEWDYIKKEADMVLDNIKDIDPSKLK
ncbi:MAG: HAD family phosphatase [Peptoniphilaceae bacterium]|nr:HAD family phosphatase [Peptoniphilaceae bacterium]MDY6019301.1 HAD family phosphatase [Anaerococcus sp.]